jgi:hypothetical protein
MLPEAVGAARGRRGAVRGARDERRGWSAAWRAERRIVASRRSIAGPLVVRHCSAMSRRERRVGGAAR